MNARKVYPADPALIPVFDRSAKASIGHALETVVCIELLRRGFEVAYVRTPGGYEVDFLARGKGGQQQLIQVCASIDDAATRGREVRALLEAQALCDLFGQALQRARVLAEARQAQDEAQLQLTAADPDRTRDFKTQLEKYPLEIFAAQQDYLENYISKWDSESLSHRVTGVAANDCHHNQVVTVKVGGPDMLEIWMTGDKEPSFNINTRRAPRIPELTRGHAKGDVVATFDLDPYERSLSYVTTHILASKLDEAVVRNSLRSAHAYVSHDWLCNPQGFAFIAESGGKRVGVIGDEVKFGPGLSLKLEAPVAGKIKVFRNGKLLSESDSDRLDLKVTEPGVYRPEVWLNVGGELRPWIYSNPIRVR